MAFDYSGYPETPDVIYHHKGYSAPTAASSNVSAVSGNLLGVSGSQNTGTSASGNSSSTEAIKAARPDIIITTEEATSIELMTDLIFENIGGQELINIARTDIVNGQNVIYHPIKNLSSIYFKYNPQNILALQKTSEEYFKKFPIKLGDKIPTCGTGPDCKTVYIDSETGNLIINVINLEDDEQVEVQILINGKIYNGTIYEAE
jgi:hypothetical protein